MIYGTLINYGSRGVYIWVDLDLSR